MGNKINLNISLSDHAHDKFASCMTCASKDGTARRLVFRDARTASFTSVALCRDCRNAALAVLREQIANDPTEQAMRLNAAVHPGCVYPRGQKCQGGDRCQFPGRCQR